MGKNLANSETTFLFCDGGSCQKAGSEKVVREARAYLRNHDLWDKTHTIKTRCNGRCEDAPTSVVYPGNHWYKKLDAEKITKVIASHVENQQPIEEHLLYSEGWKSVQSEDERKPIKPKDFALVDDAQLGKCFITKGFSSDQYLYPLFQYITSQKPAGTIQSKDHEALPLSELVSISYEGPFSLEMNFTGNRTIQLVIGSVPNTQPQELIEQKITATEYYYQLETTHTGIRFKNKKGILLAQVDLGSSNPIWNYCLKTMLSGLALPKHEKTL